MPFIATNLPALSRLLDEALDMGDEQLDRWLAGLDATDLHLAPLLREVLASRARLRTSDLVTALPSASAAPGQDPIAAGDLVGPYRLLRVLGHGGMGSVWLAERADGSFERQVALKLPRLAWDDRIADRMARERAIGALLEHPNIARLYDAGVDPVGRPFLALEFVDGQPIDAWCDARSLSLRARLALVLQVARAVSYAHGRLVVHRDIKPSNVLVSDDGQAHLLDFGIAKRLDDGTPGLTREHGRLMTPQYASPEQLSGQPITVASDVHALGTLCYELLTGQRPYQPARNTVGAMEEAILGGEPAAASSRAVDPARQRALRGELDAILSKALQRDPARRYATADAFADDVERHLRGDVVLARPDSLRYRGAKLLRRHALAIGAGAMVLAALLVGVGVALLQARRANEEAHRARLVKEFVVDIFNTKGGPNGSLGQMPGHALLERSAGLIDPKFAGQPLLQADLHAVVSDMFFSIANNAEAMRHADAQVRALEAARAPPHDVARALVKAVEFRIPAGSTDAEALARRAVALAQGDDALLARADATLANVLMFIRKDMPGARVALDAARAALAGSGGGGSERGLVAFAQANWLAFDGQVDAALAGFDEAISLALPTEGPTSRLVQNARLEAFKMLALASRVEPAKGYLAEALKTMRAEGGVNDANAALWEARGALWFFMADDGIPFAEARAAFERSLAALRAQRWSTPERYIATVETNFGRVMVEWGDIENGRKLMLRSGEVPGESAVAQWWGLSSDVAALAQSDRAAEAPPLLRRMLALQKEWQSAADLRKTSDRLILSLLYAQRPAEATQALADYQVQSAALAANGSPASAKAAAPSDARVLLALELRQFGDVLAMTDGLQRQSNIHAGETAWLARASALCGERRFDDALRLFDEWLPRLAHQRYEANPQLAAWRARMGLCALDAGQRPRARDAAALASAALARQPGVSGWFKAPVLELEHRLQR